MGINSSDDNLTIFECMTQEQINLEHESNKLDVVKAEFCEAETLSWEELFEGFEKIYAITYSSSMDFVCKLLEKFKRAEIIFGFEDVLSYNLQEVMAYQLNTIELLREKAPRNKLNLMSRIDDGSLRLFVARKQLSHEKIYLLEADDGRKRVVMGSANLSYAAFSGIQRENITYMDGKRAFDWYYDCFLQLREDSSDNITSKALKFADDDENFDEIPVAHTVKVKKALVIEPDIEAADEVRFALDVKNLASKFSSYMPKTDKKGKIVLSPDIIKRTNRRVVEAKIQDRELRSEYPELVVNIEEQTAVLNGRTLSLNPDKNEIAHDVSLFLEYMNGFERFHGDVFIMQRRYYEFANWFFSTPFMAQMRNIAVIYNQNLLPYPVFGLVYGQSKAGKTSFLETLLKMMIGQKTKMSAPDFTRTAIEALKRTVKGAPIIVDDLTQARFSQHAVETIKNDDFGVAERLLYYPAVVISANEDVKAVSPELVRRTVLCRVQAGLTNTELMKSNIVRRVQQNIGTAFYREYLRKMLSESRKIIEELKNDEDSVASDILAVSSEVIYSILNEHSEEPLPHYVRTLTLDDYFGEKVTGANVINIIQNAWKTSKKAFIIDKKLQLLRYNAAQPWEADRIIKELPENLKAQKSREWVNMDLDKACEFFDIDFKRIRLFRR